MANICCSIEMEPKTLNQGQLHLAREVAADVVQKMEPNEASAAFIEGSRPLVPVNDHAERKMEGEKQLHDQPVGGEEKAHIIGGPCQCACTTTINVESPDQVRLREPLTAPF